MEIFEFIKELIEVSRKSNAHTFFLFLIITAIVVTVFVVGFSAILKKFVNT